MLMKLYFSCTTPTPTPKVSYKSDCTDTCIFRSSKVWLLRCIVAVTDDFNVIVSVGRLNWKSTVLTDEAEFTHARLVVPRVNACFPHEDAVLVIVVIVRLTRVPVCVVHSPLLGPWLPYELGTVFAQSCYPNRNSSFSIMIAFRLVIYKQSVNTLTILQDIKMLLSTAWQTALPLDPVGAMIAGYLPKNRRACVKNIPERHRPIEGWKDDLLWN